MRISFKGKKVKSHLELYGDVTGYSELSGESVSESQNLNAKIFCILPSGPGNMSTLNSWLGFYFVLLCFV